jgi:hypothetical protein
VSLPIAFALESVDIQASQMTLATNAIKEAKRAASFVIACGDTPELLDATEKIAQPSYGFL